MNIITTYEKQFVDKVNELFKDFEIRREYSNPGVCNSYWLNKEQAIYIVPNLFGDFRVRNRNIIIYKINHHEDSNIVMDELVIFVELILPKYL